MRLSPRLRLLVLTAHILLSVGWLGALAAYTALDLVAGAAQDPGTLRAAYLGMAIVAGDVIVPLAIAAWVTGVGIALGTKWGLLRHWWVVVSLILTTVAAGVLLLEMRVINGHAATARNPATTAEQLRGLDTTLPHSVGGMIILLVVLVLNMYKPRGLTRYGWRKQQSM